MAFHMAVLFRAPDEPRLTTLTVENSRHYVWQGLVRRLGDGSLQFKEMRGQDEPYSAALNSSEGMNAMHGQWVVPLFSLYSPVSFTAVTRDEVRDAYVTVRVAVSPLNSFVSTKADVVAKVKALAPLDTKPRVDDPLMIQFGIAALVVAVMVVVRIVGVGADDKRVLYGLYGTAAAMFVAGLTLVLVGSLQGTVPN